MVQKNLPDRARYTYVYHPPRKHKEQWKKIAKTAKTPLSKFFIGTVDSVIDENAEFKPLRDDLRQKAVVIERYEGELKKYRSQSSLLLLLMFKLPQKEIKS
jgi:hypothetical protein